ncbi:MAG: DNA topoisomerase III [Coxiellaceae bacterium]|nr:DNA topoisomerase III [Coxiellaceae bacterium]
MKLFICEKPAQARDIARNLNATNKRDGYLEGNGYQVTWCIGHLLELAPPEYYKSDIKPWRIEKLPVIPVKWESSITARGKKQFNIIKALLKKTDHVVIATDPDREGQAIAEEVLEKCNYKGKVERLWLSALDDTSIQKALKNIRPNSEMAGLYQAARARAQADWLLGMNNTMGVTALYGSDGVLSVGRVQTPTLKLVVDQDYVIENFKSKDYFVLKVLFSNDKKSDFWTTWRAPDSVLDDNGHCLDKKILESIAIKINDKPGVIHSVKETQKKKTAPLCFSLSALQKKSSSVFGYSAKQVLDIAQSLYETHKATTYPRTDCDYLPEEQQGEIKNVLKAMTQIDNDITPLVKSCDLDFKSSVWNNKKITAHHAIIPTLNENVSIAKMSQAEFNIYDLIRRQYIAQFLGDYTYLQVYVEVICSGELFIATGNAPIKMGWKQAFNRHLLNDDDDGIAINEKLSTLMQGDVVENKETIVEKKQTKPPAHFTDGSLIDAMKTVGKFVEDEKFKKILKDSSGIGTEATRASILETLFKRGYLERKSKQVFSTKKGRALIDILPDAIKNPVLSAQWEEQLEKMTKGEGDFDAFIDSQKKLLHQVLDQLRADYKTKHKLDLETGMPLFGHW